MAKRRGLIRTAKSFQNLSRPGKSQASAGNSPFTTSTLLGQLVPTFRQLTSEGTQARSEVTSRINQPLTVSGTILTNTKASTLGIVFEIGTSVVNLGTSAWFETGGVFRIQSGQSGTPVTYTTAADDESFDFVYALKDGVSKLYINGNLVDTATASYPWSGDTSLTLGASNGSVAWVPAPSQVLLMNASITGPLSFYLNQVPIQF